MPWPRFIPTLVLAMLPAFVVDSLLAADAEKVVRILPRPRVRSHGDRVALKAQASTPFLARRTL